MGTTATFNRYVDDPTTWEQEMTIVVDDGNALLAPVLEWLGQA